MSLHSAQDKIDWTAYSTIRACDVIVNTTGHVSCFTDPFCKDMQAAAVRHGKTLTLSPGKYPPLLWQNWTGASSLTPAQQAYTENYLATLGPAVRSCGPGIQGIEFDHEGTASRLGRPGIVKKAEATYFTSLMDKMQRSMGGNYTVSEDIGVWGLSQGAYPLNLLTPWIDVAILKKNPNLFINTMSYHDPKSCSIASWKLDALTVHDLWGVPKGQMNLGIGYFTFNLTGPYPGKVVGEPTWHGLSRRCPNVPETQCVCDGIPFTSKQMNYEIGQFIAQEGFRGAFPWAANYDSFMFNNSLVAYLAKGLGMDRRGKKQQ